METVSGGLHTPTDRLAGCPPYYYLGREKSIERMADRDNLDSSDALDEVEDERRLEDEEGGLSGFEGGEDVSLPGASEEEEEDDDDEDLLDQDMDPNASESRGGSPDPLVSSSPRRGSTSAAPRRFSLAQPVSPTKLYGHHHRRAQTPPSDLPPAHSQPLHQHPGMPSMEDDIMEGQDEGELSKDEGATGDEDDRESYDQVRKDFQSNLLVKY